LPANKKKEVQFEKPSLYPSRHHWRTPTTKPGTLARLPMASLVAVLLVVLVSTSLTSPAAAQFQSLFQPVDEELNPLSCRLGVFVADSSETPDLVADCEALVEIRNHWTNQPQNSNLHPSHPLLTWGKGGTKNIETWEGVVIQGGRVTQILLPFDYGVQGYSPLQLSGTIPARLSQLTELTHLNFNHNRLTGNIPTELANLANLRELRLDNNLLDGNIPPELGQLSSLRVLTLSDNRLSGGIPAELGRLRQLGKLGLKGNQLSGEIPSELAGAPLELFFFCGNALSGQLPSAFVDRMLRNQLITDATIGLAALSEIPTLERICQSSLLGEFTEGGPVDLGQDPTQTTFGNRPSGQAPAQPEQEQPPSTTTTTTTVPPSQSEPTEPEEDDGGGNGGDNGSEDDNDDNGNNGSQNNGGGNNGNGTGNGGSNGGSPNLPTINGPENGNGASGRSEWRITTVRTSDATSTEILRELGLFEDGVLWQWDTTEQRWLSYIKFSPSRPIEEGTGLAYQTNPARNNGPYRSVGPADEEVALELQNGWNILAAPENLAKSNGRPGVFVIDDSLVGCNESQLGVLAVLRFNSVERTYDLELPCNSTLESRITLESSDYNPLVRISQGDGIFIYFRTILPIEVSWNQLTKKYQPVT